MVIGQPWPSPEDDEALLYEAFARLSAAEQLRKVRATFHILMIGEIRRLLKMRNPPGVAAMILALCAIDFLGTLRAGQRSTNKTFKDFVDLYLKRKGYEAGRLLELRNLMVHNYVVSDAAYGFTVGVRQARYHLAPPKPGEMPLIVVNVLINDLDQTGEELFQRARAEVGVQDGSWDKIKSRIDDPGLLRMTPPFTPHKPQRSAYGHEGAWATKPTPQ